METQWELFGELGLIQGQKKQQKRLDSHYSDSTAQAEHL